MKHLFYTLFLLLACSGAYAQEAQWPRSMGINLVRLLPALEPEASVSLFVEGDPAKIHLMAGEHRATVHYTYGKTGVVTLPASEILRYAEQPWVERLEFQPGPVHLLADEMRIHTRVDSARAGAGRLPQGYSGKGVVVGLIDTGIELDHPDFQNADSSTRVIYLWDQTVSTGGTTPQPYNYGQVWDSSHINAGTCPQKDNNGHGTKVCGLAVGNGLVDSIYEGAAPEADIVFVKILTDNQFMTRFTDGIDYVLKRAADLGKPAVINASLGTYFGAHDARDLTARTIVNMMEDAPGRAFVCAVGNSGTTPFHLGYDLTPDTSFTWFSYYNSIQMAYIQAYSDLGNFEQAWFSIGAQRKNTYEIIDETRYLNILADFNLTFGVSKVSDTLRNINGDRIAIVDIYAERAENRYTLDLVVMPDSTDLHFRFATTGSGRIDSWSKTDLTGTSNFVTGSLPDTSVYPPIVHYKAPAGTSTMVGSWACHPDLITVGNFQNRSWWVNYNSDTTTQPGTKGALHVSSSRGPTRTGLIKPDVVAPGHQTLTTTTLSQINFYKNSGRWRLSEQGWHSNFSGSSASAPVVAGIVALYLERYPEADYKEVTKAMQLTAYTDSFTGTALPDNNWGYGKANAFGMLDIERGCMDTAALNYNPLALLPGVGTDTCEFFTDTTGIGMNAGLVHNFRLWPNPSDGQLTLLTPGMAGDVVRVFDLMGREVMEVDTKGTTLHHISTQSFHSGLYVVSLWRSGIHLGSLRLIVP